MIGEAIVIGLFMLISAGVINTKLIDISDALDEINDTIQRIIKRYAALENLGIFPEPLPDPPEPSQAIKGT